MMGNNFFDQFDAQGAGDKPQAGNFFDQFDSHQPAPQDGDLSGMWQKMADNKGLPLPLRIAGALGTQFAPSSNPTEDLPRFDAAMRSTANAATFRQADKLAAALDSATTGGAYGENLTKEQRASIAAKQSYPVPSAIGAGVGLAINPVWKLTGPLAARALPMGTPGFTGALKNIGNISLQGGLAGATDEALNRDSQKERQAAAAGVGGIAAAGMVAPEGGGLPEFAGDVGKAFVKNAATSAVIPTALEGGSSALHMVLSPILKRLAPEEEGLAQIYKAMEEDGLTPSMLSAKLEKRGDFGALANVSPGLSKLAEDTVQYPGEARTVAQRFYGQARGSQFSTAGGPVGRVQDAIAENLSSESAQQTAESLLKQRSEEGDKQFRALFATPAVPESAELTTMQKNKAVQSAMQRGITTAQNFADSNGVTIPPNAFFIDGKPTAQAWHLAKSELDNRAYGIASGKVAIPEGESADTTSIKSLSDSIRGVLKSKVPGYADTVENWAGDTAALNALQLGAKAARGDARITSSILNDMSDSEREFFRIGLADQANFLVSKTSYGSNVVKSIFGNQNAAKNLSLAFDTRGEFNQFRKALMQEQSINSGFKSQLGGSPTASREAGMGEMAKGIGEAAIEGAKEGGVEGAVMQGGKAAAKGVVATLTQPEAMRSSIARVLYSRNAEELAKTFQHLKEMENGRRIFGSPGMAHLPGSLALATQKPFYFGGP